MTPEVNSWYTKEEIENYNRWFWGKEPEKETTPAKVDRWPQAEKFSDGHSEVITQGEWRIPLKRDMYRGKRMMFRDKPVIYCGQSSSGSCVVEWADRSLWTKRVSAGWGYVKNEAGEFVRKEFFADVDDRYQNVWPCFLKVKNDKYHPKFDEVAWKKAKEQAEYDAWVEKGNEQTKKINTAIRRWNAATTWEAGKKIDHKKEFENYVKELGDIFER